MGEANNKQAQTFDPFESFRSVRDAYLETMSKAMIDAVNTEAYAEASGAVLDGYLTASAPFREALEKNMLQALQQLSLPSRQEVAALAERFTNVEMRLDDMDAKLDSIAKSMAEEKDARIESAKRADAAIRAASATSEDQAPAAPPRPAPRRGPKASTAKPRRQGSAGRKQS